MSNAVAERTATHARTQAPSSDAEVFFTAVFGVTAVLIVGEMLFRLLLRGDKDALGPALLSRTAPLSSVRPLYAFFILLPAGLGFLAIGLPFFLRTLNAAARGRLRGRALQALIAITACALTAMIELRLGGTGLVSVVAAAAIAAWQARGSVARFGESHGFSLLSAAGLLLGGLAWYESQALAGAEASIAIAPTMLVAALFFAGLGLIAGTAAAFEPRARGRIPLGLGWVALGVWLGASLLRSRLADSAAAADHMELTAVIVAAVTLLACGLTARLRAA